MSSILSLVLRNLVIVSLRFFIYIPTSKKHRIVICGKKHSNGSQTNIKLLIFLLLSKPLVIFTLYLKYIQKAKFFYFLWICIFHKLRKPHPLLIPTVFHSNISHLVRFLLLPVCPLCFKQKYIICGCLQTNFKLLLIIRLSIQVSIHSVS